MTDTQVPVTESNHCNQCRRETKHYIRAEYNRCKNLHDYDGNETGWVATKYTLLECCGCESITVRCTKMWSEDPYNPEEGFLPPRVSRHLPDWYNELPAEIQELLQEIYTALYADSRRLTLMGLRTVIDRFIHDKVGDQGNFKKGLEALKEKGYLGIKHEEILATVLDAGNAAAHRAYKPTPGLLSHVLDVVEHLVHFYALERVNAIAKAEIPPRNSAI